MGRETAGAPEEPLLGGSGSLFAPSRDRPARDVVWKWIYVAVLALATVGGVYGFTHRNPDFGRLISPSYLSDPAHCPSDAAHGRRLLKHGGGGAQPTFFMEAAGVCTAASIGGGVALALASLWLFKRSPAGMVTASCALQVGIPAAIAAAALLGGSPAAAVPFALVSGLLALTLYLYRAQLALVARLLGVSLKALGDMPGVVAAALGVQALGLLVLLPLAAAAVLALSNGAVAPNPARASVAKDDTCLAADGSEVMCCTWQVESWVPGYLAYVALAATWTTMLVFSIKAFTIAGATAQWYFAPAGGGAPKGATLRSARYALGPSFGTLCLSSWLLTLIQYARAALDKIRQDSDGGVCVVLLTSCLDFVYSIFEAVTRFGVVRASITGEALAPACRGAVDLLARNLLDTVGVWWLPGMILQVTALMFSVAWGLVTYGASTSYWGTSQAAVASGVLVGLLSWLFAFVTLGFFNSILLNMVDATYVAWAMDRDASAVTRSDVHAVFDAPGAPWIKAPGAAVQQPDAEYAYGAPAPAAPQPYPSPMRV